MIQSTSHSVSQGQQQTHLAEQSAADSIRHLMAQCKALASQYRATPEVTLERAWWRSLYEAGVRLRDTLETWRDHRNTPGLSDTEVEQAYFTLIHIAYFFEPGGAAEKVFQEQGWVWTDADEQRTPW